MQDGASTRLFPVVREGVGDVVQEHVIVVASVVGRGNRLAPAQIDGPKYDRCGACAQAAQSRLQRSGTPEAAEDDAPRDAASAKIVQSELKGEPLAACTAYCRRT